MNIEITEASAKALDYVRENYDKKAENVMIEKVTACGITSMSFTWTTPGSGSTKFSTQACHFRQ